MSMVQCHSENVETAKKIARRTNRSAHGTHANANFGDHNEIIRHETVSHKSRTALPAVGAQCNAYESVNAILNGVIFSKNKRALGARLPQGK